MVPYLEGYEAMLSWFRFVTIKRMQIADDNGICQGQGQYLNKARFLLARIGIGIAEADQRARPFLFAVGPMPPPVHGQAETTKAVVEYLSRRGAIYIANVSPSNTTSIYKGLRGHATKCGRVLLAMLKLPFCAVGRPRRNLYMSVDGAYGILYNIAVAAVARLCGYRIYVHYHSFAYVNAYSRLIDLLARVMGKRGRHIVLCDTMKTGLQARYPWIRDAIFMELASAAFIPVTPRATRRMAEDLRIGFLSNLIIEKGLDTCIDLLRQARKEGLPVQLAIAGAFPDAESESLVRSAELEFGSALEYCGRLSEEQKAAFLCSLDIFSFPTRYVNEAQPRAIIEAMCFGVPVITVTRGCIPCDIGGQGGLCIPVDTDFVEAVMPQIRQWCDDRALLAASGAHAAQRAAELHKNGLQHMNAIANSIFQEET